MRGAPDYNSPNYSVAFANEMQDQSFVSSYGLSPLVNSGRVYYVDFYDNGLYGWDKLTSGAGVTPVWKMTQKRTLTRPYSIMLDPGGNGGISWINRNISSYVDSKHGIEVLWTSDANHGHFRVDFGHVREDGTSFTYTISYNVLDGTWRVGAPTGGTVFRTEVWEGTFQQRYVRVKMTYDIVTGRFDAFYLGDQKVDLSSFSASALTTTSIGLSTVQIVCSGANGTWCEPVYVSGIIWTVDEP